MTQQRVTTSLVIDGPADRPDVLASDADRDTVAAMLSSAFAEGRLAAAEHAERVRAVYEARTMGELRGLTGDLPGPVKDVGTRLAPLVPDDVDRCLLCALLICCPPAGIAWLLVARRRARADGGLRAANR
jgi:hypothetical protein